LEKAGIGSYLVTAKTIPSYIRRITWSQDKKGYLVGIDTPVYVPRAKIDRLLTTVKSGQFMTGHVGYNSDLLDKIIGIGITPLLIVRDPRAIMTSFVNYVAHERRHPLHELFKISGRLQCYRYCLYGIPEGDILLKPLLDRFHALSPWYDSEQVVQIRFEDLVGVEGGGSKNRQHETLMFISEVLGLDAGLAGYVASNVFGSGRATFRVGNINSWKDETPASIVKETETLLGPVMHRWSYI